MSVQTANINVMEFAKMPNELEEKLAEFEKDLNFIGERLALIQEEHKKKALELIDVDQKHRQLLDTKRAIENDIISIKVKQMFGEALAKHIVVANLFGDTFNCDVSPHGKCVIDKRKTNLYKGSKGTFFCLACKKEVVLTTGWR